MNKLLPILAFRWIIAFLIICSVVSIGFATLVSVMVYVYKELPPLNGQTWSALEIIWFFSLSIGYVIGIITGVIFALRPLLYRCISDKQLVLLNCKGENVDFFELKPYFKFWRKWFFTLIWINASQVIAIIALYKLFFGGDIWLGWFNGVGMGLMIIVSGAFAVVLITYRSKRIRIEPCS